jgi:hypothetical protein
VERFAGRTSRQAVGTRQNDPPLQGVSFSTLSLEVILEYDGDEGWVVVIIGEEVPYFKPVSIQVILFIESSHSVY